MHLLSFLAHACCLLVGDTQDAKAFQFQHHRHFDTLPVPCKAEVLKVGSVYVILDLLLPKRGYELLAYHSTASEAWIVPCHALQQDTVDSELAQSIQDSR